MANQEFTVAQNIRRAPPSRIAHARVPNEEFTVAQNIRRAPPSRIAHARVTNEEFTVAQTLISKKTVGTEH